MAMTLRRFKTKSRRAPLRDLVGGLLVFLMLLVACGGPGAPWSLSHASAADQIAARAIGITSPAGPGTENAIFAAVLQGPVATPGRTDPVTMSVLGLTFSLMFAFNLGLWRHLRRVYASPRRGAWRRDR